jgi:hypothetical protein
MLANMPIKLADLKLSPAARLLMERAAEIARRRCRPELPVPGPVSPHKTGTVGNLLWHLTHNRDLIRAQPDALAFELHDALSIDECIDVLTRAAIAAAGEFI